MKIKQLVCTSVILILLFSCNRTISTEEQLHKLFKMHDMEQELEIGFKKIMIIPYDGCSGCVKTALKFFNSKKGDGDFIFVISTYRKWEMDAFKNDSVIDNYQVIHDYNGDILKLKLAEFTPTVYFVSDGLLIESASLSVDNDYEVFDNY